MTRTGNNRIGISREAQRKVTKVRGGISKAVNKIKYGAQVGKAGVELGARMLNPKNTVRMVSRAARGKGLVLPGSRYIGPGNYVPPSGPGKPKDQADANALEHDRDYDNYLKKGKKKKDVYLGWNQSDKRLLKKTKANTASGLAVNLGMGAKRVLGTVLQKTGVVQKVD